MTLLSDQRIQEVATGTGRESTIGEGRRMAQEIFRRRDAEAGVVAIENAKIDLAQSRRDVARIAESLGVAVEVERFAAEGDATRDGVLAAICIRLIGSLRDRATTAVDVVPEVVEPVDAGATVAVTVEPSAAPEPPFDAHELQSLGHLVVELMRCPVRPESLSGFRALRRVVGR